LGFEYADEHTTADADGIQQVGAETLFIIYAIEYHTLIYKYSAAPGRICKHHPLRLCSQ
jgi:hypothetical protein